MIVDAELWPPNSPVNQGYHAMGREYVAHGLYFKLLSLILPLHPFWYYLANYLTHVCVVSLSALLVWRSTRSATVTCLLVLTVGFASTGPEVFLTLFKLELPMTLWMLLALLALQRLLTEGPGRFGARLGAIALATFLAGTLGKESFVILLAGLVGALAVSAIVARPPRAALGRPLGRLASGVLAASIGAAAAFLERRWLGTSSVSDGTYTKGLVEFNPTLAASCQNLEIYWFHAAEPILLATVAAAACLIRVCLAGVRKRDLVASEILACVCAAAAIAQVVLDVVFLKQVLIYYMYPATLLGAIALACLWPTIAAGVKHAPIDFVSRLSWRIGLAAFLAVTIALNLPLFALRLYVQSAVPAMEWRLLSAIAATPPRSLVLLGFPEETEMVKNSQILLHRVLGRSDISVRSAFHSDLADLRTQAAADQRQVFVAFVDERGENWKIGLRGVVQKSRADTLALAAANGIDAVCPIDRETLGPYPITVLAVHFPLFRMMPIDFGYGWELDRLPAPGGKCG
jgi:hypothetical protein